MTVGTSHEEFLIAIGEVTTCAAKADLLLYQCFYKISGLPPQVARAIYYNLDSAKAKRNLLCKVAEEVCTQDEKEKVVLAAEAFKKAQERRNKLAHAAVSVDGKGEVSMYNLKEDFSPTRVSKSDLERAISETLAHTSKVYDAFKFIMKTRASPNPSS